MVVGDAATGFTCWKDESAPAASSNDVSASLLGPLGTPSAEP